MPRTAPTTRPRGLTTRSGGPWRAAWCSARGRLTRSRGPWSLGCTASLANTKRSPRPQARPSDPQCRRLAPRQGPHVPRCHLRWGPVESGLPGGVCGLRNGLPAGVPEGAESPTSRPNRWGGRRRRGAPSPQGREPGVPGDVSEARAARVSRGECRRWGRVLRGVRERPSEPQVQPEARLCGRRRHRRGRSVLRYGALPPALTANVAPGPRSSRGKSGA